MAFRRPVPLFFILLTLAFTGCIIVVEEDDDYYDRHGLHGTTWTLEVLWVHGHSYRSQEEGYAVSFVSEQDLTGTAGCASFTADYDVSDVGISIRRFRTSTFGCGSESEIQSMFLETLPEASGLSVQEGRLELETRNGSRMVFIR